MQLNRFRGDHNYLGQFSVTLIIETPDESYRGFKAVLERTEHLMVNTGVESGHQLGFLLFLLESLECGHVTEVQDDAFFVIEVDFGAL